MGTQGAILESLRTKRDVAANTSSKPQIGAKVISEKYRQTTIRINKNKNGKVINAKIAYNHLYESKKSNLVKESLVRDLADMPRGRMKGSQRILYNNGDKYIGDVSDCVPDGSGIIASIDGYMYDGEWKDGEPHGKGAYIYPDNNLYVGEWSNGLRHGKGLYYIDGDVYEVEYYNGELIKTDGPACNEKAIATMPRHSLNQR